MGFQITTPTFVRHQDNHKVQDEWLYHDVSHLESTPDLEHYSQERVDELCFISWTLVPKDVHPRRRVRRATTRGRHSHRILRCWRFTAGIVLLVSYV